MEKVQREEKNGYVLYHNPGGKTIGTATGRPVSGHLSRKILPRERGGALGRGAALWHSGEFFHRSA